MDLLCCRFLTIHLNASTHQLIRQLRPLLPNSRLQLLLRERRLILVLPGPATPHIRPNLSSPTRLHPPDLLSLQTDCLPDRLVPAPARRRRQDARHAGVHVRHVRARREKRMQVVVMRVKLSQKSSLRSWRMRRWLAGSMKRARRPCRFLRAREICLTAPEWFDPLAATAEDLRRSESSCGPRFGRNAWLPRHPWMKLS